MLLQRYWKVHPFFSALFRDKEVCIDFFKGKGLPRGQGVLAGKL